MIKMDQSFTVDAPLENIWKFLLDAPRVGKCMPGVEKVKLVEGNKYSVKLVVKIGPIKVRFAGFVTVDNTVPMESMDIAANWTDKTTASKTYVIGSINISEAGNRNYQISVFREATVLGALGKYGQGITDRMASKFAKQFAVNMQTALDQD
ncbi:MAG: hypothetical protein CL877_09235 [Dehalococcoidales bacterium]|jgi:carbon monoxide dehydrogenase subunit G|nr:hypothetical protein [Dehalococcoidales bacterium]|tara:strand:- start:381 stop:833 length:453 start_codon:yes stop_codon:yes gene_type:complete